MFVEALAAALVVLLNMGICNGLRMYLTTYCTAGWIIWMLLGFDEKKETSGKDMALAWSWVNNMYTHTCTEVHTLGRRKSCINIRLHYSVRREEALMSIYGLIFSFPQAEHILLAARDWVWRRAYGDCMGWVYRLCAAKSNTIFFPAPSEKVESRLMLFQ